MNDDTEANAPRSDTNPTETQGDLHRRHKYTLILAAIVGGVGALLGAGMTSTVTYFVGQNSIVSTDNRAVDEFQRQSWVDLYVELYSAMERVTNDYDAARLAFYPLADDFSNITQDMIEKAAAYRISVDLAEGLENKSHVLASTDVSNAYGYALMQHRYYSREAEIIVGTDKSGSAEPKTADDANDFIGEQHDMVSALTTLHTSIRGDLQLSS